jgi:type I restriction enzyme R subunit
MGIFLNGLPIFTIELKNQISGLNVGHALKQYKDKRHPKEPLFRFKCCLAHFAVDNDLVYVATELAGAKTLFLPFNQGADGGAGNPPCKVGYATSYLW